MITHTAYCAPSTGDTADTSSCPNKVSVPQKCNCCNKCQQCPKYNNEGDLQICHKVKENFRTKKTQWASETQARPHSPDLSKIAGTNIERWTQWLAHHTEHHSAVSLANLVSVVQIHAKNTSNSIDKPNRKGTNCQYQPNLQQVNEPIIIVNRVQSRQNLMEGSQVRAWCTVISWLRWPSSSVLTKSCKTQGYIAHRTNATCNEYSMRIALSNCKMQTLVPLCLQRILSIIAICCMCWRFARSRSLKASPPFARLQSILENAGVVWPLQSAIKCSAMQHTTTDTWEECLLHQWQLQPKARLKWCYYSDNALRMKEAICKLWRNVTRPRPVLLLLWPCPSGCFHYLPAFPEDHVRPLREHWGAPCSFWLAARDPRCTWIPEMAPKDVCTCGYGHWIQMLGAWHNLCRPSITLLVKASIADKASPSTSDALCSICEHTCKITAEVLWA